MPSPSVDLDEADDELRAAFDRLVASGLVERLSDEPEDARRWMDCDLASLAENLLFEVVDPWALGEEERAELQRRIERDDFRVRPPHDDDWLRTPFWLLDQGERVGTIGLTHRQLGSPFVTVSSLYVAPSRRRRGTASRALREARDAVVRAGAVGLRVPTSWTWQAAVRFYLTRRLWVRNWKHQLVFTSNSELPDWTIEIGEAEARFGIAGDDSGQPLIVAARDGDRLGWRELAGMGALRAVRSEVAHEAPGTFALALAVEGWPLVRSDEHWARRRNHSDGGEPEGLAYKIEIFEAVERRYGFAIRTPRIPGLAYRDLDAID